jgi:glycolate oxidase iron-sulfur subunit
LIVQGRAAVEHVHRRGWIVRFALNVVLASPRRTELFAAPLRLMQRLKLDRLGVVLFGWIPKLGPLLRDLVQMAPAMSRPIRRELSSAPATGKRMQGHAVSSQPADDSTTRPPTLHPRQLLATPDRTGRGRVAGAEGGLPDYQTTKRVGFFLGCVMNIAYADASRASVALMRQFGCEVVTPRDQVCCGAPHDDQGSKRKALSLAMRNITAFERMGPLGAIVSDCAACSGFLKEYAHIFHTDPGWGERSRQFASKVRDITEWLDEIMGDGTTGVTTGVTTRTVTYHEPCHLAHVQGVRRQPRAVLARLKGVDVRELPDSTRCCGSAGIYNLTHQAMSAELVDRKMEDIASTGADLVVSANPGCLLQLEWGVRRRKLPIQVKHITQVVWERLGTREA